MTTHTLDDENLSQSRDTLHATFTNPCYTAHMSRHTISQSLWLRNRPFSLLDGAMAVFDWRPLTDQYNVSPTPQSADARAIASDFYTPGPAALRNRTYPLRVILTAIGDYDLG